MPTTLFQGIKTVNPTFRGYSQQVGLYCLEILNLEGVTVDEMYDLRPIFALLGLNSYFLSGFP